MDALPNELQPFCVIIQIYVIIWCILHHHDPDFQGTPGTNCKVANMDKLHSENASIILWETNLAPIICQLQAELFSHKNLPFAHYLKNAIIFSSKFRLFQTQLSNSLRFRSFNFFVFLIRLKLFWCLRMPKEAILHH